MTEQPNFILNLLISAIDIYSFIVIIRVIMSWFRVNPYNGFYRFLIQITEPVLSWVRGLLPRSRIDFSPMIVIILLEIIKNWLYSIR